MASLHSFYLEPEYWKAPFCISGPELHHMSKVLRLKSGKTIRLFDGEGRFGLFTIESINKATATLSLLEEGYTPVPNVRHTLAAGFSKALRRGWFLEKAVELEAHALWFWQGDFSQSTLPEKEKASWKANLISGAKQCENPRLPLLQMMPGGIEELVLKRPSFDNAFFLYEGDTKGRMLTIEDLSLPGDTLLVVGPEGGFSPAEVQLLTNSGFIAASLGKRILRWETAAVLALGLAWWARQ